MSGTWIDDGSNSIQSDGTTVTCTGSPPGSPANGLFKGLELTSGTGEAFWTLNFTEVADESPFVGLTSESSFGQGWAIKGYLYGGPGNISNGSGGLLFAFGESIKTGDTVGILAEAGVDRLKIYYFHNGKPLGLAFDVPAPYLTPLYPCISFNGKTQVVVASAPVPAERERKETFDPNSIIGFWELVSSPLQQLQGVTPTLSVRAAGENGYEATLKICNNIHVKLLKSSDNSWTVTVGASTMMGGSPELMGLESGLVGLTTHVKSVELEGGQLIWKDPVATESQSIVWKRETRKFNPVTSFP